MAKATNYFDEKSGDIKTSSIPYFVPKDCRQATYHLYTVNADNTVSHIFHGNEDTVRHWMELEASPARLAGRDHNPSIKAYEMRYVPARGCNWSIPVAGKSYRTYCSVRR